MIHILNRLFGRSKKNDTIIKEKTQEASDIKKALQQDVVAFRRQIATANKDVELDLISISKEIGAISRYIAIATGAKKRGYDQ